MSTLLSAISSGLGIAALPALPHGKGALILILGGILVVAMAFVVSIVSVHLGAGGPRAHARHAGAAVHMAPIVVRAPQTGLDDTRLGWTRPLIRDAAAAGIHEMTVLSVERDRVVVRLDRCRSCEDRASKRRTCDAELRLFSRLGRLSGHHVRVDELLCRRQGQGTCVFEIDRGTVR